MRAVEYPHKHRWQGYPAADTCRFCGLKIAPVQQDYGVGVDEAMVVKS